MTSSAPKMGTSTAMGAGGSGEYLGEYARPGAQPPVSVGRSWSPDRITRRPAGV